MLGKVLFGTAVVIVLVYFFIFPLLKSASDADDKMEMMMNKYINNKNE